MYGLLRKLLVAAAIAVSSFATPASAQTAPNWYYGKVPTTAEWAAAWASKQDYLGAQPCLVTGCVMRGPLGTVAPTNRAGFNLMPGAGAPSSPFDGDLWVTPAGLFVQVNGATVGPLLSAVGGTLSNLTVTGSFTATGLVTNADLTNASTTVNGQTCTLGSTCTISASAGTITVGTTSIASSTNGYVLNNNAGVLGNYAVSGTGSVAMTSGAAMTSPTLTTPVFTGTITGTYTIGGTPSIAGSAINSGTVSGSFLSNINLAASGNGGVTGTLPVANGGTGATTATLAIAALMPTPTRAGDVALWNGTAWITLAGNNSGTQTLQENSSGVASWATVAGTGTMTSAAVVAGAGISLSGTCSSTSVLNCTVSASVPHPQGRITLAANTPVMKATSCSGSACSNQTTLRYDCGGGAGGGSGVPYFNGSIDLVDPIASCEVTDAMVSAASAGQVVAAQVYDVWWVHGGANRICLAMSSATGGGGGWASDTGGSNAARGTGFSQLDAVTRPYLTNKNAIANCFNGSTNYGSVSANQGTYLGTIYSSGNGQISYVFPAIGSPPTPGLFGVYNAYNRVTTSGTIGESINSYTYSSTTVRACFGETTTYNVQFVQGLSEDVVTATNNQYATSTASGINLISGIGLDATNAFAPNSLVGRTISSASASGPAVSNFSSQLLGFHTLSCNEAASGSGGITIVGGNPIGQQTGMIVTLRN